MDILQCTGRELLEKIGVIVLVLDEEGRISLVNGAGSDLLGYPADDLVGMDWYAHFIAPEEQQALRDRFFRIMAGREEHPFYHENTILTRGGERRVIAWHNTILRTDDDIINGILSTGEDITDRVRAEERIRQSERRMRRFVDHVPEALFIHDASGAIFDVNKRACSSLGYSREELLGMNILDIERDYSAADGRDMFRRILKSGNPLTFQGTNRCKDGRTFPVEAKVNVLEQGDKPLFVTVVRDISVRVHQQRRLQDKRDLLRVIIDSIPDIICIKDGQGRWLLANSFIQQLFGLEKVAYRGKTDVELAAHTPLYREAFSHCRESDALAWQRKVPSRSNEIIPVNAGTFRVFDVYKIPLFHEDGRRKALVIIGRDITEQKRIEEKYRALFEQSPLAYLSSSLSGEIREINQAVTEIFGYHAKEIVGRNLTEFMTVESRELFSRHFPRFLRGEPFSGNDYEIFRVDGTRALVQVTATIIHDNSGEPVAVQSVIVDVTKQRRIEEQIRESEARYRQLFERAPVGIVHFDTNLCVTDCNDNYLKIMQADRERIIGLDIRKMRDKRVLPVLEATLQGKEGCWQGGYRSTISNVTIHISARTAPLYDGQGNIQGGMALVEDISRRKQAQEEKYRLMSAIDQASETIVITDIGGRIEYVNPAFEKMTGYSAAEALGKNPRILKSGRHDRAFYKEMWQTLCTGRVWKGHLINKRKDGTLFEEDASISPVRNQDGEIINYVAVKRDVTEEVTLKKQLNQAMKMEAIGTLAGGIAHDFNNILSAVLGYAEMVELQLAEDDPARKDVGQIIAAGQRATGLIQQILTFSRQEEEELRPVKIQFVLKEALKLLRSSLPTSIDLQQDIDPDCGPVLADPVRIHQVLMNLCTNAKQAMAGEQGRLIVRLSVLAANSAIGSSLLKEGRWLDLEVSDTGVGMEPQVRERIFDPFFTTKKKGQGTGLGLSVVHGIIKSHGGETTVDSAPGRGTTFHVYLPVVDSEENHEEEAVQQIILPRGDEHILLVDDEPLLVEIMERSLSLLGYRVVGFTDSRQALKWFYRHGDRVDLIVTDMTMPHLTGADLAREILTANPQLPIILCTGYSEVMDADRARALGIRKFLVKPVENSTLAQSVRDVLDN